MDLNETFESLKQKQSAYVDQYYLRLSQIVTSYMSDDENVMVPTLENLEQHEQTMASYFAGAHLEVATCAHMLRMAKFNRDKVRGSAKLGIRDHYSNRDLKMPPEHLIDAEVSQSPLVEAAEVALAEAEERYEVARGMLEALRIKATLLPGLQGQRNQLTQ